MTPKFDYIKCPLNRYTFSVKPIKEWVENNCIGKTLNLFAGKTKLNIDEVRNDLDVEALADYRKDALQFLREWEGEITRVLNREGIVITFGYHSNTMGSQRGFTVSKIALFSHGGAIHDTIASVEKFVKY